MNHLYICSFGFDGQNLHTSRLMTEMTAEEFYDEMADVIREQYNTEYVYITTLPPLTNLHNRVLSDSENGGSPKIYG
jgi:Icc-related predicted phosphoesterase